MKAFFGFRGERSELMVVSFGKLLDTSENGLSDIHNFSHSSGLFIFVDFFCSFSLLRPKGCGHSHNSVDEGQGGQAVDEGSQETTGFGHLQVHISANAAKFAKTKISRSPKKYEKSSFFFSNCKIHTRSNL